MQDSGKDIPLRPSEQAVAIAIGPIRLHGDLVIPPDARGIVLFAHGSGSSRFSSRNRYVAGVLQQGGFATLLLDLLTEQEEVIDQRHPPFALRHPAAGRATHQRRRLAWSGAGHESFTDRTLRGQHGRWRGTDHRGRPPGRGAGRGLPRWASRFGRRRALPGACPDLAHRRQSRRAGHPAQPAGHGADARPNRALHRPWRHPPLRGTWHARSRSRTGFGVVYPLSDVTPSMHRCATSGLMFRFRRRLSTF